MKKRPQRLASALRNATAHLSRGSAPQIAPGSEVGYDDLTAVLHSDFTASAQHRDAEYLHERLGMITAGMPEPLTLALSRYLAAPEAPGSPLALRAIPATVAADVALLPAWSPTSGTGAPFPEQLRRLPEEVDATLVVDFDVYWCDDCTLTDTPGSNTHWLIEVATIWAPQDLTAPQQAALQAVAATCGADYGDGLVTYVGAGGDCPPGCSAHQDHRSDCRPRGGPREMSAASDHRFVHDRVEDAVRAAVTARLGEDAYEGDRLTGWAPPGFPPTLLEALRPVIESAGMHRGSGHRPWFTVTLPMHAAARIIVNYAWAPELDIVDSDPTEADRSGYYAIPAPMLAGWLLASTPTNDQHWTMQLRFTDLTAQQRPSGVDDYARSSADPARSTGTWTVSADWIKVSVDPDPGADVRELTHQARNAMLTSIGWSSFAWGLLSPDHQEFWRSCGTITFHDAMHTSGPRPADVCSCGALAIPAATTGITGRPC